MNKKEKISFFNEGMGLAIEEGLAKGGDINEIRSNILRGVYKYLGGLVVYIPTEHSTYINSRNALILEEFKGSNHIELSRKYGLSLQAIYKIIEKHKKKLK
ncbi:Mor transcription activator family protein [Mannheimia bovis]|uniref:Mor transcription activator family protein n=1 Tax=Mannheimia bovis TaxID=2770636 RepID=UPI0024B6B282|nr:Mor transcription activator family protein [Mannheimia bovis]WHP47167.1 Mor transcription activator family protein [Mannheimia bovis]